MKSFYRIFLAVMLLLFSKATFSQTHPTFDMTINNLNVVANPVTLADSLLQFDIFIKHTNASDSTCNPFEFGAAQFFITFNPALYGSATTISSQKVAISGGINFPAILQFQTTSVGKTDGIGGLPLIKTSANLPVAAANFIVSSTGQGNRMARIRLRTTLHSWPDIINPDFKFQLTAPNNTFVTYFLPPVDPKEPDNQLLASLLDTVANHYTSDIEFQGHVGPNSSFYATTTTVSPGQTVNFIDAGINIGTHYNYWYFPGGTPSLSSDENPVITYNTPGVYSVHRMVTKHMLTSTTIKTNYIIVNNSPININLTTIPEGFLNISDLRLSMRDTVKIFIRQTSAPYSIVDSSKAVIDSTSFTGNFALDHTPAGTYYIVTVHRNGLETWSKSGGIALATGSPVSYDFTTSASQAYGDNLMLKNTKFCFYSGDIEKNGVINLADVTTAYNNAAVFESGYVNSDITGDKIVNLADITIVFNNLSKFVSLIRP